MMARDAPGGGVLFCEEASSVFPLTRESTFPILGKGKGRVPKGSPFGRAGIRLRMTERAFLPQHGEGGIRACSDDG